MPPKKAAGGPSKKTEEKKKAKIVEDKTFGLKNKKGAKTQQHIKNVEKQVKFGQLSARQLQEAEANKKGVKQELKKKEQDELNMLFKPVAMQQKVAKGADPKSVVCAFYKQGTCQKGDKCKFSHDLAQERKGEKRSMYVDVREDDTIDNWDEAKLEEVINKKHGESDKARSNQTDIICKYFLQALEDSKYGWFWECPNGEKCIYRHCLPPGFVLKKDKKKPEDDEEQITLEELIETERSKLGSNVTKITLESFLNWKKQKRKEKVDQLEKDKEKKQKDFQQGRAVGLSGRDMFTFKPELAMEDDEEAGDVKYERELDDDEVDSVDTRDIDESLFTPSDVDNTGTISANNDRMGLPTSVDSDKLNEATGGSKETVEVNEALFADDIPVDEELFAQEALDGLDDELENLDLDQ